MNTEHPHLNSLWADLIVEELVRQGIDFFCLSPGSRSTPLVASLAANPRAKSLMHFDERGAAFCALGRARATGRPAVLICTSGTAAANYFPAVIEAAMDRVPLLVLTADRPPELRATGANQTIDQQRLYGPYPRWFFELPCPDPAVPPQMILTTIDQAVYRAQQRPAGPVHLNLMYREPLAPLGPMRDYTAYLSPVEGWRASEGPFTRYHPPTAVCEPAQMEAAAQLINAAGRGLIVVGRPGGGDTPPAIAKVARALGWPVIADVASGLRLGDTAGLTIPYADQILCSDEFALDNTPEVVLHFGAPLTSKRVSQWLGSARPAAYIHVADHAERTDPDHLVTHRYDSDLNMFGNFLLPFLTGAPRTAYREKWVSASAKAAAAVERVLRESRELSEPFVARAVTRGIPPGSCLFVASSMPIRDLDSFADPGGSPVPVATNRGASGIDGTLATAVGFSIGWQKPCTLLIGDLALLHDLNSLALVKHAPLPIMIVVLNNDGGGIFHFLPIAERADVFERHWGTPHGLTFEPVARMFDLEYAAPSAPAEFEAAYRTSCSSGRSILIEVRTNRDANFRLHLALSSTVAESLKS